MDVLVQVSAVHGAVFSSATLLKSLECINFDVFWRYPDPDLEYIGPAVLRSCQG